MKNKSSEDEFFDENFDVIRKTRACEMCGTSHGKIVKIKIKGKRRLLCEYCLEEVFEE